MITQDSLRFYKSHAVYPNFGGVVLDREEGRRIAECLGDGKAAILQNHGLITVWTPLTPSLPSYSLASPSNRSLSRSCKADTTRRSGKRSMLPPFGSSPWTKRVRASFWRST